MLLRPNWPVALRSTLLAEPAPRRGRSGPLAQGFAPPFIRELTGLDLAPLGLEATLCRFDLAGYRRELFRRLDVDYPFSSNTVAPRRQAQFLAGRCAARTAMARSACKGQSPARGADGEPVWEAGLCGSISHSGEVAIAAVASGGSLGLDYEPLASAAAVADLWPRIACDKEWLLLSSRSQQEALSLVFSAKESLYKALYPRLRRYIDFCEVELVAVDFKLGALLCRPRSALALALPRGALFTVYWRWHQRSCLSYTRLD